MGNASNVVQSHQENSATDAGIKQAHSSGKLQNCDYTVLKACVAELKKTFVPSKIDQVSKSMRSCKEVNYPL